MGRGLLFWLLGVPIPLIILYPVSYTHLDVYKRQGLHQRAATAGGEA